MACWMQSIWGWQSTLASKAILFHPGFLEKVGKGRQEMLRKLRERTLPATKELTLSWEVTGSAGEPWLSGMLRANAYCYYPLIS